MVERIAAAITALLARSSVRWMQLSGSGSTYHNVRRAAHSCRCPIEKSQFLPDRNVTAAGGQSRRNRHHCLLRIRRGGVKGHSRRQPVRAAQPLRPTRPIRTLRMPCDLAGNNQGMIEAIMARDTRPFDGNPGVSRLFGGRCRAACPRRRLGAYSA
jgi:hypothetical protein